MLLRYNTAKKTSSFMLQKLSFFLLCLFFCGSLGAQRAKISGYVHDVDGNPIELATVLVKHTLNGSMTNEKGFYSISVSKQDSVTLIFSCLGFNKAQRILPVVNGDRRLNVTMHSMTLELGQVYVTAIRKQTNTMESIDAKKMQLLPDPAGGSIESLVVTFAGVTNNNELSSQYSVRGGSYDENIVYVNGIEVFRPLLIRSGQQEGLSFINPDLTGSVHFSAGGFEPRYGDKMSSVLDITYKKPTHTEGSVKASLMGGSAYLGTHSKRFTQVTGIRYKTGRNMLGTLDTDAEYDPSFLDAQTYMTYAFTPKVEVNFLGNYSLNNYKFIPYSRETSFGTTTNTQKFKVYFDGQEKDRFETLFGALTLRYKQDQKNEIGLRTSAFQSLEKVTYDIAGEYWINSDNTTEENPLNIGRYHQHTRNKLKANVFNVGLYGKNRIQNHTVNWGALIQREQIYDHISEWEKLDSAGYSLPHLSDGVNMSYNLFSSNKIESTRFSAYAQDAFRFRTTQGIFTLIGGLRSSYWSFNKEMILSPRASLGFIPKANQDLTFRLATGIYYQAPFFKELRITQQDEFGNNVISLNEAIKSQRSIHFIASTDYTFKQMERNYKWSTSIYYKKLDNLNPYTVDNVKIRYYGNNDAKGYAMGMDMKFFGEFVPGTDSWISLSLMKSQQTISNKIKAPLPNDPRYSLSMFFQDYFAGNKRIKLNLKGVMSGGLPVTVPNTGYENGYFRTPTYKRIDLGLSYELAGGKDAIMDKPLFSYLKHIWLGLDIFNLFDMKNINSYYWITDINGQRFAVPNYLTGRQLNARIIIDF